jgi:outer membrane protein assembly factor BamB
LAIVWRNNPYKLKAGWEAQNRQLWEANNIERNATSPYALEVKVMRIQDMVFIGLNGQVAALDNTTGEIVWEWRAPKGSGYVNLLVDRKLLIAAVNGYVYGLDPKSGDQLWFNKLKGYGVGVTSIATLGNSTSQSVVLQAAASDEAAAAAAAGGTVAATS